MKNRRVAIAAISMESNTFSPYRLGIEHFRSSGYLLHGEEVLGLSGTNTEIGGMLDVLGDRDCEVIPIIAAFGMSSGVLREDALRWLVDALCSGLRREEYSALVLSLHGALVAEGEPDADGYILDQVRDVVGERPIVCTLDSHANLTSRMVKRCDAIVSFLTFPHTDYSETGMRAASVAVKLLGGSTVACAEYVKIPLVAPSENTTTTTLPMSQIVADARALEVSGEALAVGVFASQPWLDVPDTGYSVVVTVERKKRGGVGEATARDLARRLWDGRERFWDLELLTPDEAIRQALQIDSGPVVISDPADNIGAGATGDSPEMLSSLLSGSVRCPAIATIADAPAVAQAFRERLGTELRLQLGGTLAPHIFRPMAIRGKLTRKVQSGRYRYSGPVMTGVEVDIGRSVVVEAGGVAVQATERPAYTVDPGHFLLSGLDPRRARVVVVKSQGTFRGYYESIAKGIFFVDCPGISPSRLDRLPFVRIDRPLFPFDRDAKFVDSVTARLAGE